MEKYMGNLRIILCANSIGRIIDPIRSRCLLVRVGAPSIDECVSCLRRVGSKEGVQVPEEVAVQIVKNANRNLRQALLMLEAAIVQAASNGGLSVGMQLPVSDWELCLKEISQQMLREQSPASLLKVRTKFYDLLSHCIPAELIMQRLTLLLLAQLLPGDDKLKRSVLAKAAFFEHRLHQGNKSIYHLEAFAANFMNIYKRYQVGIDATVN